VEQFTNSGTFVSAFGSNGSGNGQFNGAGGVAEDSAGNVFVADLFNARVVQFTNSGTFVSAFGSLGSGNGQFNAPTGVAVDSGAGNLFVTDFSGASLHLFPANRVEQFTNSGTFVSAFGSTGSGNGQFDGASAVALDSAGNVFVTDLNNNRVQVFAPVPEPASLVLSALGGVLLAYARWRRRRAA
jgi:DNA-binding beta-propeller fold protein YncE